MTSDLKAALEKLCEFPDRPPEGYAVAELFLQEKHAEAIIELSANFVAVLANKGGGKELRRRATLLTTHTAEGSASGAIPWAKSPWGPSCTNALTTRCRGTRSRFRTRSPGSGHALPPSRRDPILVAGLAQAPVRQRRGLAGRLLIGGISGIYACEAAPPRPRQAGV